MAEGRNETHSESILTPHRASFLSSLLVNPSFPTANSRLRAIAQELDIPQPTKSFKGMLDLFKDHLWAKAAAAVGGRKVVLILDAAHTLKPPVLELLGHLINYGTSETKVLQFVRSLNHECMFNGSEHRSCYNLGVLGFTIRRQLATPKASPECMKSYRSALAAIVPDQNAVIEPQQAS